ncbi:interleukin-21 receptor isoform X2 [Anguilla anguilla]|uniref:interleukin-21 receptor isoform X2 n=1 Tax=Anguilla anguilla TaxID=7936 RepID=UPI0015B11AF7|nr:interleukin-21 receptor isoform X2 [Anguilla anguilla]
MERYRDGLKINILLTFIFGFNSTGLLCAAEAPKYKLACLNDYVVTISCVLNISIDPLHDGNGSYWLEFEREDKKKFECPLVNQMDRYCCTVNTTERFIDSEHFVIAFCFNKNADKSGKMEMDKLYKPKHNIKPIAPINLTAHWSSSHYQFTWDSGYEKYISRTFMERLKYRLQYYKHGHPDSAKTIHSGNKTQHIDGSNFEPGTEYIAKVCSSPDQDYYKGHWSEWSTAVKWRTDPSPVLDATPSARTVLLFIGSFSFLACMLVGVLVCLKRCRIKLHSHVPTPAPYFQPLYSNYNGDLQSWLVSQSNLGEPFTMEETLKIDPLFEVTPIVNEERFLPLTSSNQYVNVCGMVNQDNVGTPPLASIQKSSFEVLRHLSLEEMGTSGDDLGCEGWIHSPASIWLPGTGSSLDPQSMCCSKDYCILIDTNTDLILSTGME